MSSPDKTVELVPRAELVALARLGKAMRAAQRAYFDARKKVPFGGHDQKFREAIDAERRFDKAVAAALAEALTRERVAIPGMGDDEPPPAPPFACTARTPCCPRRNEYNGFASGPTTFTCPRGCGCHD